MTHSLNTNNKPTAKIENWCLIGDPVGGYLVGKIGDHPRQSDFYTHKQKTSRLVSFNQEEGVAETLNTFYTLGSPYVQSDNREQK